MNEKLKEKVKESLSSVLPITLIVLVLSVTARRRCPQIVHAGAVSDRRRAADRRHGAVHRSAPRLSMTAASANGRRAQTLAKSRKAVRAGRARGVRASGSIITIAEPDLQVLANQVRVDPRTVVLIWTLSPSAWASFWRWPCCAFCSSVSLAKCLLIAAYAAAVCADGCFPRRNFSPSRSMPAASRPGPSPCRLSWRWASACQPSAATAGTRRRQLRSRRAVQRRADSDGAAARQSSTTRRTRPTPP